MEYTTQMDAARKGIITKEMEAVAKKEYMDVNELVKLVACGKSSYQPTRIINVLNLMVLVLCYALKSM